MGKILLIISIVLAASSAGVGLINRSQLLKTKDDLSASQQETAKVKTSLEGEIKKLVDANKAIGELTAQKQGLETDLANQKSELGSKTSQLTETQSKLTKAVGDLAIANTENLTKTEKITQLETQVAAAAAASQTPASSEADKAAIAKLEQDKENLIKDNENLTTKLASLQQAAREREAKQALTRTTGRVLAVNPAWNFVVLSLGNKSGIESNMEFVVKRGSTLIGKVRTTTVEPSTSIADIIPASLARGLSIQPGDDIVYQTAQN